jgi:gas vesicle protein
MSENNSGKDVMVFAIGGLIGAALGLLLAPCSGDETRKRLAGWMSEGKDKARHFITEETELLKGKKEQISAAWEAGKKAYKENTPA